MLGLRFSADLRTLFLISLYFVFLYVCWTTHGQLPWGLWAICYYCLFYCAFIGTVASHNHMHMRTFKARWANSCFQYALGLTYGGPPMFMISGHNLSHHKYTQLRKDLMRTSRMRYRWHLLNLLLFVPTVSGDVLKADIRFARLQANLRRPSFPQMSRELVLIFAAAFALMYLDWRRYILYYWAPHMWGQYAIVTLNVLQHDGCPVEKKLRVTPGANGQERDVVPVPHANMARNFTGGVINWFCFNNGFHSIHHMHPGLHWSELPAAHERHVAASLHPALNQRNIFTYIWKTFVYPGKREMFDGSPIVFDDNDQVGEDVDWIAYPPGYEYTREQSTVAAVAGWFMRRPKRL